MAKPARKAVAKKKAAKPARKPAAKKAAAEKKPSGDRQRFTLYGSMTSGPTYTVGLMLALCRHPFSYFHVNLREGQHKQPDYLVKNRYGQVPALRDRQVYYVQSAAILQHLADGLKKFDGKTDVEKNRIREWLFWQWDKLAVPVFRLRARARGLRLDPRLAPRSRGAPRTRGRHRRRRRRDEQRHRRRRGEARGPAPAQGGGEGGPCRQACRGRRGVRRRDHR